jgi:hypothetical protein
MFKNPLAISVALFGCLVALAFAKGKTMPHPPAKNSSQIATQTARIPASVAKPVSLQSAN